LSPGENVSIMGRVPRLVLLTMLFFALAAPASAARTGYIVVYEDSVPSVARETASLERAEGFESSRRYAHAIKGFAADLSAGQAAALRADPQVAAVVRDRPVHARESVAVAEGDLTPFGSRRIETATETTAREAATTAVAVLDTGVDLDHPDLDAAHGTNCVTPGQMADDDDGHGTHVAGVIGARNDGDGVVGVAPGTKLYSVKVLNSAGDGEWSDIICGVDWVTANARALNIRVANLSLGGTNDSRTTCNAASDPLHGSICRLTAAGVLAVVAAGNDQRDFGNLPVDVPSTYPEVLTVTAMGDTDGKPGGLGATCSTHRDDRYVSFSSWATRAVDTAHLLAAPGACVRSTLPGAKYGSRSGTSMAAPHVAALAALCIGEGDEPGRCATQSPGAVVATLRQAAVNRYALGSYGFFGDPTRPFNSRVYGRLAAPASAPGTIDAEPTPTPDPTPDASGEPDPTPEPTPEPGADSSATTSPYALPGGTGGQIEDLPLTAPDTTAPRLKVKLIGRPRLGAVLRAGLRLRLRVWEPCTVTARPGKVRGWLAPGTRRLTLKLTPAQKRALRRTRVLKLSVRARDAAGNARTVRKTIRFRRR
jgi:subtilisin